MECNSATFIATVKDLLKTDCLLIAAISERGQGFIQEMKNTYKDSQITINNENRNDIPLQLLNECKSFNKQNS